MNGIGRPDFIRDISLRLFNSPFVQNGCERTKHDNGTGGQNESPVVPSVQPIDQATGDQKRNAEDGQELVTEANANPRKKEQGNRLGQKKREMAYQGAEHFEFRNPTRVKVVNLHQQRGKQNPKSRQNAKNGPQLGDQVNLEVGFAQ